MHWFYAEHIDEGLYIFDPQESKHAVKVLRLQKGDEIVLTNGKGSVFRARIEDDHMKKCTAAIFSEEQSERKTYEVHIAVAPTKNISRFEWFLEKATEIGIDEIAPMICEHSERVNLRTDRLQKIIITAMKQSQQAWLPKLNKPVTFDEFLNKNHQAQKFIAYVDKTHDQLLQNIIERNQDTLILIGPEGDFSQEEIKKAISSGFTPISLGKNRLRTETAALVACHTVNLINQPQE